MAEHAREQLKRLLSDVYSMEQQALAQLRKAPDDAGSPVIARHFRDHLAETERQAEMVKTRLEAVGGSPSQLKDAVMRLGGKGFLLFARIQPDTPGKLTAHSYSYEAMELAAYDLLERSARRAGDEETARIAAVIGDQERAMRDRLASDFEEAVEASLDGKDPADVLPSYLADAHALQGQAVKLLEKGRHIAGHPTLARLYEEHREESESNARRIEQHMDEIGERPSALKDVALRAGGLNWGLFFQAMDDTPSKLAAFVYAFEHLEIAGYEMLRLVARRAGDTATERLCHKMLEDDRAVADRLFETFEQAFEASAPTFSTSPA